jgi:hypothetical protein
VYIRKPPKHSPLPDFGPWTTAFFHTEEARDRFLRVAASQLANDVEVKSLSNHCRRAAVRWRPGKFLGLNDVAYAHGGRILPVS